MSEPKRVAVIGAGPSGLVAAKSLIHDHPPGTFAPIIYEKLSHVGGIWPVRSDDQANIVPPDMPTNASKHLVSFSDLAWDSVKVHQSKQPGQDIATFPKAHEVGKYLQTYADKYIPSECFRFGTEVISISETDASGPEWNVISRASTKSNITVEEKFNHVIVASGFFAAPEIPKLHGLDNFQGVVIHSSQLRDLDTLLSKMANKTKIVVIGGSMSGGEAAATLAFQISSDRHAAGTHSTNAERLGIYHVTPRPFWSVPPYVPLNPIADGAPNPCPIFAPLDVVFADLSRRPGDQIRFAPSSTFASEAAEIFNALLQSLMGSNQSGWGDGSLTIPTSAFGKPPWLIISTTHAEFVRSGDVKVILGRAAGIEGHTMMVHTDDGEAIELADVGMIVMATGFTPHPALSFLSPAIRQVLEYDLSNQYDPIKLFNFGTMHPLIPSLGFVGFYRGPYFGVLEQQARFLGALWSNSLREVPNEPPPRVEDIKERGQFPMGDYVGLMESFAAILGSERLPLSSEHSSREGPAVPARYPGKTVRTDPSAADEQKKACEAMIRTLARQSLFVAPAVFRALQGRWKLTREIRSVISTYPSGIFRGEANMYPRKPTDDGYAAEFLYTENGELATSEGLRMTGSRSYVYRLSEFEPQAITVWFVKPESGIKEVDYLFHQVQFHEEASGQHQDAWGSGWRAKGSHHLCVEDHYDTEYWFRFHAIEIKEWGIGYTVKGPNKDYWTRATYAR
ncbi:hypothetical protein GJ744_011780 [Endocarpon pusillum]|uniref:DUF6314 domain-containing protein n=1 Tax=Endocarpon pusillum TaxID=364733 RepID=A0A8H7E4J9_9EURO|nr:hypothetical protein GJ744_011780 [Endocarpon pusillum]